MAKIKFGMMMTDARGKLGGQVFSKNRSGAYVRTKVTPVNPRTTFQQASRALLSVVSQSWSALSDVQRASFNSSVAEWAKTDIFGDLKNPTGKNLYSSLNKNLLQTSQPMVDLAPAKVALPNNSTFELVYVVAYGAFEVQGLDPLANGRYILSCTPVLSAGTSFFENKLRVLAVGSTTAELTIALNANYSNRFGDVGSGDNLFAQLKFVGSNGQASAPFAVKVTVI